MFLTWSSNKYGPKYKLFASVSPSSSIHPRSAHIPFADFFSALTDRSSSFSKLLQAVVSPLASHHSLPSPHYPIATSRLFPCSSSSSLSRLFWLCSGLFTVIVPCRCCQPYQDSDSITQSELMRMMNDNSKDEEIQTDNYSSYIPTESVHRPRHAQDMWSSCVN